MTYLFEGYFLKSFSSRLAEYSNPEIEVDSKKKINENYTIVSSILVLLTIDLRLKLSGEFIQKTLTTF